MKNKVLLFFAAMLVAFLIPAADAVPLSGNGDGTVSDYGTGLMWQQAEGNEGVTMNWESALNYCNELSLANATDWRLPNVKELESITDDTRNPPVDTSYFPGASGTYWSSTTYFGTKTRAWYVDDGPFFTSKTEANHVRCVRTTCTYAISPETGSFETSGGSGTVSVAAFFQSCPWETSNDPEWVAITAGDSGTGDGTVQFTVSANSGAESRAGSITIANKTFIIAQAGVSPSPLTVTTPSLGSGRVGAAYSQTLSATGGLPLYTWEVISGSLPPGLFLNTATGEISGAPTTIGSFNFTVQVTDAASETATGSLSIAAMAITSPPNLPYGIDGQPYSFTFAASGGTPPYTWSASSSLPPGLSLNSTTGVLSGIPQGGRSSNQFAVRVTDAESRTVESIFTLQLYGNLVIATSSLPDGTVGVPYNQTLAATGGDTFKNSRSWWVISGTLPAGLSLTDVTGVISGTPTSTGSFLFTVQVMDPPYFTATKSFSITVNAACSNVRIAGMPATGFDSIVSAYNSAEEGDTIESLAADFTGDLAFDRGISFALKGGYECGYSGNTGMTRVIGTVSIIAGTLTIENIQIE